MIGFLIGFVSFLASGAGLGGGVLLIPMLIAFAGYDSLTARIICLIAYVIASIFSLCVSVKSKMLTNKIFKFIPLGILGVIVGSFIKVEGEVFSKFYGGFLIIFGVYIIWNAFFKQKSDKTEKKS